MKLVNRTLKVMEVLLYLLLTIAFAVPTIAMFFGIISVLVYPKVISLICCLILACKISNLVKSIQDDNIKARAVHGRGFYYTIKDDKVTFTFKDVSNSDGRAIDRLKFIREKDFE